MSGIMDILTKSSTKLKIKRYQSHKFCYDTQNNSVVEYDPDKEVEWLKRGRNRYSKNRKRFNG